MSFRPLSNRSLLIASGLAAIGTASAIALRKRRANDDADSAWELEEITADLQRRVSALKEGLSPGHSAGGASWGNGPVSPL